MESANTQSKTKTHLLVFTLIPTDELPEADIKQELIKIENKINKNVYTILPPAERLVDDIRQELFAIAKENENHFIYLLFVKPEVFSKHDGMKTVTDFCLHHIPGKKLDDLFMKLKFIFILMEEGNLAEIDKINDIRDILKAIKTEQGVEYYKVQKGLNCDS